MSTTYTHPERVDGAAVADALFFEWREARWFLRTLLKAVTHYGRKTPSRNECSRPTAKDGSVRNIMRTGFVLIVGAFLPMSAAGQNPAAKTTAIDRVETNHLVATTSVSDEVVTLGTRFSLQLDVSPKPKMHVYAPGQKDYIPISLKLQLSDGFKAHAPVFPKPEKLLFVPLNETQLVYSKPFRIVQDVTVALTPAMRDRAPQSGASLTIQGTMRYQACDDQVCYVPKEIPVTWSARLRGPER